MNGKKSPKWFRYFRVFGVVLFFSLLFSIDLNEVWANLKKVKLSYFLLAVLFQVIMLCVKGLRWHLLKKADFLVNSLLLNFGTFFESYAIGVVTPGRIGELAKSGYENSNRDKWSCALKVLAERGFDLGIFFFIAGYYLYIYNLLSANKIISQLIIGGALCLILTSIVLLVKNRLKTWIQNKIVVKLFKCKQNNNEEFNFNYYELISIFFLSLCGNLATFISCFFLAKGINLGSSFWLTSGAVAVTGVINLLPITVMGLGTREISFLYIFSEFNKSLVLAFSFLIFLVVQVGGGLIAMIMGQTLIYLWKKQSKSLPSTA